VEMAVAWFGRAAGGSFVAGDRFPSSKAGAANPQTLVRKR